MLKRGRPALAVPDVEPMDVFDVFMTFRQKGINIQRAASAAMYGLVANQVGWENLGLSRPKVYEARKLFIEFGINPDRIVGTALPGRLNEQLAKEVKRVGEEKTRQEFREATGLPEPVSLEVEPGPVKFIEPGPVVKKSRS